MKHSISKKSTVTNSHLTEYSLKFGDGSVLNVDKETFDAAQPGDFYEITLTKTSIVTAVEDRMNTAVEKMLNRYPSAEDLDAVAEEAAISGEVFPTYASWTDQERALLGQDKASEKPLSGPGLTDRP